ncbi:MAG: AAA family ATPase, partial [Myxococcales bacterium]|nr:AAA family ATPase [Myxococcales bacterium]
MSSDVFEGTERFELIRRLGEGGMGVVYLARDRLRDAVVALKTLRRDSPYGILRLKSEFRSLADVAHQNLIDLHDLHEDHGTWFFTMEYVDGVDFNEWVRPRTGFDTEPALDLRRLRHGLRQLVRGVAALHEAGHLHRDIKPTNVLVETATRRLVLLDFGLVTPLEGPRIERDHGFSGTLEYMAPEQADGDAPIPASDWYAVGVVLFEALTGQLPFRGKPFKIMIDKRRRDAPPPSSVAAGIPEDLDALCLALLRRDPAERPTADAILAAVGIERRTTGSLILPAAYGRGRLIGREGQMAALEDALAEARGGRSVLVGVHGGSGMGKSALLRRFLDPLVEQPDLMVLSGRCYERESVPYKAFDSVIDALTRRLGLLPDEELAAILPGPLRPLTRLFPVLLHVDAIAVRSLPEDEPSDPRELRQRGFALLRRLFDGLARRMVPVIHIDDLQWGDLDSAALLTELVRGDDAPPMLVIGSYRTEEVDSSAFLRAILKLAQSRREAVGWREIVVGPLDEADAARLARARLGDRDDTGRLSGFIARESRGNPFFVEALARHLQQSDAPGEAARPVDPVAGLTVDAVVRNRVESLDHTARRLMHALAVFGRPLDQRVALDAAAVAGEQSARTIGLLRAEHLLRVRATGEADALEVYHDRIREAVTAGLPDLTLRSVHMELGLALERREAGDPETLAEHFLGAGDLDRARRYTTDSAERAATKLAFDRAAELYRRALDLHRRASGEAPTPGDREQEHDLLVRLGRALVDAGRGAEAAEVLLEAARGADPEARLELSREAGAQLLISGKLKAGLEVMRGVLDQIGMSLPKSTRRALASLLTRRARLRIGSLGFTERDESRVPRELLTRIDACWSVALGLGLIDHVRAADFQTRSLLLALQAGEPYRIARAMAMEVAYASATGPGGEARAERLVETARAIADRIEVPHAQGMSRYGAGVAHFLAGRWRPACEALEEAAVIWRDRCRGANWETTTTAVFHLSALAWRGEVGRIAERVPALLAQARERGIVYFATNLRTGYPSLAWLVLDDPEAGVRHHEEAMAEWGDDGFHVQ